MGVRSNFGKVLKRLRVSLFTVVFIFPLTAAMLTLYFAPDFALMRQTEQNNAAIKEAVKVIESAGGTVMSHTTREKVGWRWYRLQSHVTEVSLSGSGFGATGVVGPILPFPRTPELFAALRKLPAPYYLHVHNTDFNCDDLQRIAETKLRSLRATHTMLADCDIVVSCPPELIAVYASHTGVGDQFITWASSHGNLHSVGVTHTQVTDASVPTLKSNELLTFLLADKSRMSADGRQQVLDSIRENARVRRLARVALEKK